MFAGGAEGGDEGLFSLELITNKVVSIEQITFTDSLYLKLLYNDFHITINLINFNDYEKDAIESSLSRPR